MNYKLIDFNVHGDNRGKLIAIDNYKDINFEIKRVYWIYDTLPNEYRGYHSHPDMQQLVVALDGHCEFELDDGINKENIVINRPDLG